MKKEILIDTIKEIESIRKETRDLGVLSGQLDNLTARFYELEYQSNKNRSFKQKLISKFPSLYIILNRNNQGLKNTYLNIKGHHAIRKNHLFNIGYYLQNNGDVRVSGADPLLHYLYHGYQEGRNPHPQFDTKYYTQTYPDVQKSKLNPLIHYSLYGKKEKRKTYQVTEPSPKPAVVLTEREAQARHEEILKKNSSLFDLHPFDDTAPLVSIIILNRNGMEHLKRLFKDFEKNIQYPNYEVLVVDNASTDDSVSFLEEIATEIPLNIIKNTKNESFSKANNQAVKVANGEYVLLLNNDTEPTYGWLNQMMHTGLKYQRVGTVGAKLVYPDCSASVFNKHNSFRIQHTGIVFQNLHNFFRPYNRGSGGEPFDSAYNSEHYSAGNTAAALLVKKDLYQEVGGLDEDYYYGYEDVDFCLKLLKNGYKHIYCPTALLFHYEFGSDEKIEDFNHRDKKFEKNRNLLMDKWFDWLSEHFYEDKLEDKGIFSEKALNVAFVVTECGVDASAGDYFTAMELGEALQELGWGVHFLPRSDPENWYNVPDEIDVLISLLDAYDPRKVRSNNHYLVKIAWPRNWFDRWAAHPGLPEYDLIFASSQTACDYIKKNSKRYAVLLPIATNISRFNEDVAPREEFSCDYCFTGSYWDSERDIITMLDPESLPFQFKLYGKNWEQFEKFQDYYQGFINYSDLPAVYASTKIVIDDANHVTKEYGAVNSRVYDALATGTLVITNGKIGAEETFKGLLPYFTTKEELAQLLEYYLTHPEKRIKIAQKLQKYTLQNHTYQNRAQTLKKTLTLWYELQL
ncbi:glycosyltransferase [Methanobacterium sp. CWC-01]|uniref:glycosyltransferase family protein n=1 Tax=Methanobacterium aridiramus TaxID=2584467 RepID=UPI002576E767|nr:glycosyltransferase [Methanobacterium sp. CWC-01]WJI08606.1 glycosyltransferase [Methanobacterium sp. CWC-01]